MSALAVAAGSAVEETIAAAERAVEAQDHREAIELLQGLVVPASASQRLALRALLAEAWARMTLGQLAPAGDLLERARELSEGADFTDSDRADVLYRLAASRLQSGKAGNAAALLSVALRLCDGSDRLRVEILERRARAYLRMRDWDAACEDVDTAVELATRVGEPRLLGHVYLAASNVAERRREWLLARFYAEEALELYRRAGDRVSAGKVLNNLGVISALLGRAEDARGFLSDALALAEETGAEADRGYAWCSLARLELEQGEPELAEAAAGRALALLADRADHASEAANASVVLGRALAELGRLDEAKEAVTRAERLVESSGAPGRLAAVWTAQGDIAARDGKCDQASALYRRAAELLQDVHF